VTITAAGKKVIDEGTAAFETAIADLVAGLTAAQRSRLSAIATIVVSEDARRRGFELFDVEDGRNPT
jgi:hypothetical protein